MSVVSVFVFTIVTVISMDTAIAIRTAVLKDGKIVLENTL